MAGWSLANLHLVGYMAKARGSFVVRLATRPSATPFDPPTPTRVAFRQRGEGAQLFAHHQQVTPGQQIPQGLSQYPADGGASTTPRPAGCETR